MGRTYCWASWRRLALMDILVTRSDALALVGRMEKNFTSGILKAVFKYYTFVSDLFLGGYVIANYIR